MEVADVVGNVAGGLGEDVGFEGAVAEGGDLLQGAPEVGFVFFVDDADEGEGEHGGILVIGYWLVVIGKR